jgi:hypothetical protein
MGGRWNGSRNERFEGGRRLRRIEGQVRHCVTHAEGRDGTESPDDMINKAMAAFERLLRS